MKRVIQIATLLVIGLCVGAMLAQQPKPPTIPDAVQARFWKAQAQVANAQAALQQAQQQAQQAIREIEQACGTDKPTMDAQGNPSCVSAGAPHPEAPKAPKTPTPQR